VIERCWRERNFGVVPHARGIVQWAGQAEWAEFRRVAIRSPTTPVDRVSPRRRRTSLIGRARAPLSSVRAGSDRTLSECRIDRAGYGEAVTTIDDRLRRARVLVELGRTREGELEIAHILEQEPDHAGAMSLAAKIRHIQGALSQTIAAWAWLEQREPRVDHRPAIAAATRGSIEFARAQLEQLGREGLAHDPARLTALLAVYQRLDSHEARQAADRIRRYRHAETRCRLHRPTLSEILHVAAREYVPLASLRALPAESLDVTGRELALLQAIRGDDRAARMLFADGGQVLDRLYLADLAALADDCGRAIELYLGALADGARDVAVIGWLLDHTAPAIERYFERDRTAHEVLREACTLEPQRPELWRWLARLEQLAGLDATTTTRRAELLAIPPIGRVLAAGVYHLGETARGLIHEVWVHRHATAPGRGGTLATDDIHGNLTAELRAAIRNTFVAVREYARAKFPHATTDLDDYTYSYKLPKEDEQSGGLSAGLPSALAFLSVFLQRPVPLDLASTGTAISEAHDMIAIGRIGEAEYKVEAAYECNLATLILPLANRSDVAESSVIPLSISTEIVRYATDLDQVVKLVFGPGAFTD
jgi:hypothetical protein